MSLRCFSRVSFRLTEGFLSRYFVTVCVNSNPITTTNITIFGGNLSICVVGNSADSVTNLNDWNAFHFVSCLYLQIWGYIYFCGGEVSLGDVSCIHVHGSRLVYD